jgi:5-(carboxyamino)imidazole ribonucleotide mutase
MPGGVPIASVGIGGARNAGFFAAAILASSDPDLARRLEEFRVSQAQGVAEADERVQKKLAKSCARVTA